MALKSHGPSHEFSSPNRQVDGLKPSGLTIAECPKTCDNVMAKATRVTLDRNIMLAGRYRARMKFNKRIEGLGHGKGSHNPAPKSSRCWAGVLLARTRVFTMAPGLP